MVFTVTGTSTAVLNSTVQVRVTSDPTGRMGLDLLLVTVTEVITGTEKLLDDLTLNIAIKLYVMLTNQCWHREFVQSPLRQATYNRIGQ